ncbi:glucosyltransferase domain-containing protein [Gracilibacillus xinjiangensis]|uniref:Glucosyltransferase domain-containing protein n=1 Tax=Gracilibacillus xinjiangensis TaxID=1193282 RepID=A0ABV8WUZ9_9BACI
MPEKVLEKLRSSIKAEWKVAFFSALIIGFFTHIFIFTNLIPNHDGLFNLYSEQERYSSGRFFLGIFSGISSYFYLPWVNGTLSVLYLSLSAVCITELFQLKKKLSIILCAGILVTFPTVAATFTYMFTADGYILSILAALLALVITKKYRFGFIPGALVFYLSVGVYQANLTIVLTIASIWFITELLKQQDKLSSIIIKLVHFIMMTVGGMGLYAITFISYQKFFSGDITSYQGLDEIGQGSGNIKEKLLEIYEENKEFFFNGFISDAPVNLWEILNLVFLIIIVIGIVITIVQNKVYRSPIKLVFIAVSIFLTPIFAYSLFFVSPSVDYHMLMVMGHSAVYLLPVIIYDRLNKPVFSIKAIGWSTVIVSSLIIFNFAVISNIAYFNASLKYEKSYAVLNRIVDRIEQLEGYDRETSKIALIGKLRFKSEVSSANVRDSIPNMTGAMGELLLGGRAHYFYFSANFLGSSFNTVSAEELEEISNSETVENMEPWPSKESVVMQDDVVVIKLSK